jgi:hypothetical protein
MTKAARHSNKPSHPAMSTTERARRGWQSRFGLLTPEQRFWDFVNKSDGCWDWTGRKNHRGYGEFTVLRHHNKAHRYSWSLVHGPIPDGMQVCHNCDNRACVRPDHLFLGTNSDNQVDAVKKGRRPHMRLNEQSVREIRVLALTMPKTRIARLYGVTSPTVHKAVAGETWRHVKAPAQEKELANDNSLSPQTKAD